MSLGGRARVSLVGLTQKLHSCTVPQGELCNCNYSKVVESTNWNGIWPNRGTDGHPYPDSKWDMEIELCKKSVDILNSLSPPPAFFIVCGDLVDAYGHQYPEIREKQEFAFKEVYSNLNPGIPMICVCGNHDIGNSPTKESIDKYITSFGDDYFSFYKNGCCFLVLNSQFYADASNCPNLYQFHERWLDEELQKANSLGVKHIFLFQHIPWLVKCHL